MRRRRRAYSNRNCSSGVHCWLADEVAASGLAGLLTRHRGVVLGGEGVRRTVLLSAICSVGVLYGVKKNVAWLDTTCLSIRDLQSATKPFTDFKLTRYSSSVQKLVQPPRGSATAIMCVCMRTLDTHCPISVTFGTRQPHVVLFSGGGATVVGGHETTYTV